MFRKFICITLMLFFVALPIVGETAFQAELYDVDKKAAGEYLMSDMVAHGYNILTAQ